MVVDTSAIIAIIMGEPEEERFATAIDTAPIARLSAATALETSIIVDQRGTPAAIAVFDRWLASRLTIEPVTAQHLRRAREAYGRYGKGNHKAALNFGDCFAYALAKATGEPLLFKGNDFAQTDIKPAIA